MKAPKRGIRLKNDMQVIDSAVIKENLSSLGILQSEPVLCRDTFSFEKKITAQTAQTAQSCESNSEFLTHIFPFEAVVAVCSFAGDPDERKGWPAAQWTGQELSAEANNYFSPATFRLTEGKLHRRKETFIALHALMIDDIGGKVPRSRLTLEPSWLIETSSGNYQAGYVFDPPVTDRVQAEGLLKAITVTEIGDKAGNNLVRWARLPFAINGKSKHRDPEGLPFVTELRRFNPSLRYSVEELVLGLELALDGGKTKAAIEGDQEHYIGRPEGNPVIQRLKERNLYTRPTGSGWHECICPWHAEHDDSDLRAYYAEPSGLFKLGSFKCQKGRHADRRVKDLLNFLGVEQHDARMKPTFRVVAGDMHLILHAAEQELARDGRFYQRGGSLVRVETDSSTQVTAIRDIPVEVLSVIFSEIAIWQRLDGRTEEWHNTDPPVKHLTALAKQRVYNTMPPLRTLSRQPYLRDNGSLVPVAGYDTDSQTFGTFDEREFTIPTAPTRADADEALALLQSLLVDFEFATEGDRSAAIGAMLTAVIRPSLPQAPMFHIQAPLRGSGKSYLSELIAAMAAPEKPSADAFPADDTECSKLLLARLAAAPAVIEFDNLTTDLKDHKSLCSAITGELLVGRVLGETRTITVATRTLFLSSGNNVEPVGDMVRRCVTITLHPRTEDPVTRSFSRPYLLEELRAERGRYVSAALTLILAMQGASPSIKPLASFGRWSEWIRAPLVALGLPDPAESIFRQMANDPVKDSLGRILQLWHQLWPQGATASKVLKELQPPSDFGYTDPALAELNELLQEVAGDRKGISPRLLAWWLKRHRGRIVGGLEFSIDGTEGSRAKWRAKTAVTAVTAVISKPNEKLSQHNTEPVIKEVWE